jgi:hypothetical protein
MTEHKVKDGAQVILKASYKDRDTAVRIANCYISHGERIKMVYEPTDGYKVYIIK